MDSSASLGEEFIVLYYRMFSSGNNDIIHFYAPSARICRNEITNTLEESQIIPEFIPKTEINIVDYDITQVDAGFNLTVTGIISDDSDELQYFFHNFVIQPYENKPTVFYDCLYVFSIEKVQGTRFFHAPPYVKNSYQLSRKHQK